MLQNWSMDYRLVVNDAVFFTELSQKYHAGQGWPMGAPVFPGANSCRSSLYMGLPPVLFLISLF